MPHPTEYNEESTATAYPEKAPLKLSKTTAVLVIVWEPFVEFVKSVALIADL